MHHVQTLITEFSNVREQDTTFTRSCILPTTAEVRLLLRFYSVHFMLPWPLLRYEFDNCTQPWSTSPCMINPMAKDPHGESCGRRWHTPRHYHL